MNAPAGDCEWCGGPQNWTIIAGDFYVSCKGGCLPLGGIGLSPPMGERDRIDADEGWEHPERRRVEAPTRGDEPDESGLPF